MKESFGTLETKSSLAMALVEMAAIMSVGEYLCIACYALEGDSPLILSVYNIFSVLEKNLEEEFNWKNYEKVFNDTVKMINDCISFN